MNSARLFVALVLLTASVTAAERKKTQHATAGEGGGGAAPAAPAEVKTPPPPDAVAPSTTPQRPALITTSLGGRDLEFLMTAFEGGKVQAWLGEQAKSKGESDHLRAIGDALSSTQKEENEHLAGLAAKKGVNLTGNNALPAQQKTLAAELAKLSGPKRDKALIDFIIEASQHAVTNYEAGLQSKDEVIHNFAEQMLPIAKEKLQIANKVAGNSPATGDKPQLRGSGPSTPPPEPTEPKKP